MGEKRGMKALELWCRRVTDGYPGVQVHNMTTSWRDGLAFCALIHHFRPDLIDFDSLNKDDIFFNNDLAFRTAELHLGIPALLDAEDMVEYDVPDKLSILTYLSQFYQAFAGQGSPSPTGNKRPASSADRVVASESPPSKVAVRTGQARREPCAKCGLPVFIAERLIVSGRTLFHRSCFRCARCHNQLSLANFYETEDGKYCCETCPDEVESEEKKVKRISDYPPTEKLFNESFDQCDYSSEFEKSLEKCKSLDTSSLENTKLDSKFVQARTNFLNNSLLEEEQLSENALFNSSEVGKQASSSPKSSETVQEFAISNTNVLLVSNVQDFSDDSIDVNKTHLIKDKLSDNSLVRNDSRDKLGSLVVDKARSVRNSINNVPESDSIIKSSDYSQPITAKLTHDEKLCEDSTKESVVSSKSFVKMRLKMFEQDVNVDPGCKDETDETSENIDSNSEVIATVPSVNVHSLNNSLSVTHGDNLSDDEKEFIADSASSSYHEDKNLHFDSGNNVSDNVKYVEQDQNMPETTMISASNNDDSKFITNEEVNEDSLSQVQETSVSNVDYPEELNPFGDDDDNNEISQVNLNYTVNFSNNISEEQKDSASNPFGDSEDEESHKNLKTKPPRPPQPAARLKSPNTRRIIKAPQISLNPFWSDGEEPTTDEERDHTALKNTCEKVPVPRPRTIKSSINVDTNTPYKSSGMNSSSIFGSASSLSSITSSTGGSATRKKKKPAPKPPSVRELFPPPESVLSSGSSRASSPTASMGLSPKTVPHHRKTKPAPLPPLLQNVDWEHEKVEKDFANRNRQSQSLSPPSPMSPIYRPESPSKVGPNKSTFGQWKRKKGPAPPRPIPQRRQIKSMPMLEVKQELEDIEVRQQELERQGVKLEQTIREKFEQTPIADDAPFSPDVEDLVLQLFELVNEKNELFRRQAELMYLRRQQRLEEEHADLEYQIRCLMERPEHTKTDSDKTREEELIQQLVEVVERRNEIVECLEMDRRREAEEDYSIHTQLNIFAAKGKKSEKKDTLIFKALKKDKKKKPKDKSIRKGNKQKIDADKDIDEAETPSDKTKEKKLKKKWF